MALYKWHFTALLKDHFHFFSRRTIGINHVIYKRFKGNFCKHQLFHIDKLEVTLIFAFAFSAIDFMLLHYFLSKSIMVLIFLFLKASSNFVLTSLVSFLFSDFLSFFSRASTASLFPYFDFLSLLSLHS